MLKTFAEGIPLDARTPRRKVSLSRWSQESETSLFIEDGVLYSYGHHYPMARWLSRNVLLLNEQYWSTTTEQHKRILCSMLHDVLVCCVRNVRADSSDEHLKNLDMLSKDLTSMAGKVLRSRESKRWRRRQLVYSIHIRNEYAGFLVVTGQITRKQGSPLSELDCYMTR